MFKKILFIFLLILFWLIALYVLGYDFPFLKEKPRISDSGAFGSILNPYLKDIWAYQTGFYSLDQKEQIKAIIISKSEELGLNPKLPLEIVRRESNFVPDICNQKFGCRSGMGLFQIVLGTLKHCQSKLGRLLDAFDPIDNTDCGLWLLKNEGIVHWEDPFGKWGSGPYGNFLINKEI